MLKKVRKRILPAGLPEWEQSIPPLYLSQLKLTSDFGLQDCKKRNVWHPSFPVCENLLQQPQGISIHPLSSHCCTVISALVAELEFEGHSLPQATSSHLFAISQLKRVKLKVGRRERYIQASHFGDQDLEDPPTP